jgi:hypothetical protein
MENRRKANDRPATEGHLGDLLHFAEDGADALRVLVLAGRPRIRLLLLLGTRLQEDPRLAGQGWAHRL